MGQRKPEKMVDVFDDEAVVLEKSENAEIENNGENKNALFRFRIGKILVKITADGVVEKDADKILTRKDAFDISKTKLLTDKKIHLHNNF